MTEDKAPQTGDSVEELAEDLEPGSGESEQVRGGRKAGEKPLEYLKIE
jgi:hypothetical protein